MKKVGDIVGKKNTFASLELANKVFKDIDIISFINSNNLADSFVSSNNQVLYDYYLAKKNIASTGYIPKLVLKNNKVYVEFSETTEQKEINEAKKISNRIKTEYISKSILTSKFSNVTKNDKKTKLAIQIINICEDFLQNKATRGLYIYGKTGIGKSYLMGCVYNYLKDKGNEPAIVYFPEFVRKMKANISNGNYNYIIDELRAQKVLIIDDIGAENITEFVRDEILVPIINYRSSENLLTFFTSNLSLTDLADTLSTTKNTIDETKAMRILDRIRYLANQVYLDSPNEREYL